MRRFRTRPSCARSVVYVEDDNEGENDNSFLFQTLVRPSRKNERTELIQEIDFNCTVLRRTFGPRGQKKRNPPRLKPIADVDVQELLEAQKEEMIRMHEDAANFSLIIEMDGQRVRQIDPYHFEPYDEEKVRQEKENKYQEELNVVESQLKELRKRKNTYSEPMKMSPTVLPSRQNSLQSNNRTKTLRAPSQQDEMQFPALESTQSELQFTALEILKTEVLHFSPLESTARESAQIDELSLYATKIPRSDEHQITTLEIPQTNVLQSTSLKSPEINTSNFISMEAPQQDILQFTALESSQRDEFQVASLEYPESDELQFSALKPIQDDELQFTALEIPQEDLTAFKGPQTNELQFTVFEATERDALQFTTLEPFSECNRPPTALDSMLTSTRYLEGTMNGTTMTKRRNVTQIVPYIGNERDGENKTTAFYLHNYAGNLNDHLSQVLFVTGQDSPISWSKLGFKKIKKLGEGSYGEVFATQYKGEITAVKIVPFNSDAYRYNKLVNGEHMLEPGELLPEILISQELSALYNPTAMNSTPNFIRVLGAHVMKGKLPKNILVAWNKYDKEKRSENDNPADYSSTNQLYLALCLAMGGEDLEKYQFTNEQQIISVLIQVTMSLVIAEEMLEFEHRDLHHGNLLLEKFDGDIEYRYLGQNLKVKSHGVRVNIIDFSLSRMSKEKTTLFKDLSNDDELFTMVGQYQYEIYRMMKRATANDWRVFTPKTNAYWLHYLASLMIEEKTCKKTLSTERKKELMKLFDKIIELDQLKDMFADKLLEKLFDPYVESFDDEDDSFTM